MISAILTFAFLYGLISFFERDRDDLDAFSIATAVVVPVIVTIFVQIGAGLIGLAQWADLIGLGTLAIATYLILAIHLEIKASHAIAYTFAVLAFKVLVELGFMLLTGAA